MATLTIGANFSSNMNNLDVGSLFNGAVVIANAVQIRVAFDFFNYADLIGSFQYNIFGEITGGTILQFREVVDGSIAYRATSVSVDAEVFASFLITGNDNGLLAHVFRGNDTMKGGKFSDVLKGYNGNDAINGNAGNDILSGLAGNDTINGGKGNDKLAGGTGNDKFVFSAGFGRDVITDFVEGAAVADRIALPRSLFPNFKSVLDHADEIGGKVVIAYNASNRITLNTVDDVSDLRQNDFLFV